jgi:hypothetical protein
VELEARLDAGAHVTWTCSDPQANQWEEVLSASSCAEVVLTSRLEHDFAAKDLVLGLAEHLMQKLAKTQSLVTVRFLPEGKPRT